jgi:hypothetical protein
MRSYWEFARPVRSGFTQLAAQFVTKMINGNHAIATLIREEDCGCLIFVKGSLLPGLVP